MLAIIHYDDEEEDEEEVKTVRGTLTCSCIYVDVFSETYFHYADHFTLVTS